ncbi:MAG: CPBP family intramembrane metalloprotease [Pyrinomonadaceae bacterium]|nr:CPBP family intramembrane metalloprotease [Pyrinomonadaceae bacterium]
MSTPNESSNSNYYAGFTVEPLPTSTIDPDNPPWSVGSAVLVWLASVAALVGVQLFAVLGYGLFHYGFALEELRRSIPTDRNLILISITAVLPTHILTLGIVWALVTGFGKRPFWKTLGWDWGRDFGFWTSAGLAIAMLLLGGAITKLLGGSETQLDQIIGSSTAARFAVAFLATATAPLVEEVVYRGVLYPALQRAIGALWAVIGVSTLFTLVHVLQYSNNLGVITAISLLSLALTIVRARARRLLPCFVIHLVFNGIQSLVIIFEPYMRQLSTSTDPQAALLTLLVRVV